MGMISSSLIGCSFVNMSSIGSSRQPQLSHLSQKMLGCVVSLTSSHLSGSTIRDVNNGGSVLCSNSSFSSLLSSPNTDTDPSITYPNGTYPFVDDGTEYLFEYGTHDDEAIFSHCHFTGDKYATTARPLTFKYYRGTISISSCSFTNHTIVDDIFNFHGSAISIEKQYDPPHKPVTVEKSNFTNITANGLASGMHLSVHHSATILDCIFTKCRHVEGSKAYVGGMWFQNFDTDGLFTITNLVFESCSSLTYAGGMFTVIKQDALISDCLFADCSSPADYPIAGGFKAVFQGTTPQSIARMNFTDCQSLSNAGGMELNAYGNFTMSDFHFLRCHAHREFRGRLGGGLSASHGTTVTLTMLGCSFIECSSDGIGGALHVKEFGSCVLTECLFQDCSSNVRGAIRFQPADVHPSSISLTRVAFANNSVGQNEGSSVSVNSAEDPTSFVDVYLDYLDCDVRPTLSIIACFTTCDTNNIGMLMTDNRGTPEQSTVSVFDDAFKLFGPQLTEAVQLSFDPLTGRLELEMKGEMPIASQKYEVTIEKEGDTTKTKGVIEFVNGKGTLTSPSPSLTLDYSTSYTITSIVGIAPSSSSSLSNALTFPQAAWVFNLAATPDFVSFATPTPPTLVDATADLVSEDQPLAFVVLVFDRAVSGSHDFVVEEEGKDVTITIHFEGSSLAGVSNKFVVVGEDRLLTHDSTYTIKSITQSPGTESPFVWMNDTITFHIPKSSFTPKKSMSPEMKTLLSWLIPLIASLLVVVIVVIVLIVLLRRRRVKSQTEQKEMEEQTDERLDEKIEVETVAPDNTNAVIHAEAISHSNFRPDNSLLPTEQERHQVSKSDALGDLVEVMKCSGDFVVSTARMDTTLYSLIHTQKKEIGSRTIGVQIVNGLKHVVAHRGWSDVLTQLSPHWILLDSAGNVHLKLEMNSTEAEQAALLAQKQQNAHAAGMEGEKVGMDGLRWRAPEIASGSGEVDSQNASVFSLGLILWEIETGLVPYGEVDAIVAQKQSGTGIAPKLSDLHDEEFIALLTRCLSVNPKERPTLNEVGEFLSTHKPESAIAESRNEMKTQVE
ncbi:hypothetical protein BLNAU_21553 [Blattamonas nauphoetae]|uniref:Protein kinase domain-containing protein n=1 Tax=Blattamonas nauphoetae TaxID=2049346 RepID=A0ABQ9WVK9_9EUKA|nr:hypothetical protein BLNAU_21553 [Blattamonas nauphoetae]